MSAEIARELSSGIRTNNNNCGDITSQPSSENFMDVAIVNSQDGSPQSFCNLESQESSDVNYWLRGSTTMTESTGVQPSRVPVTQRSTLATGASLADMPGVWYMLAMILPLMNINSCHHWMCSSRCMRSTVGNAAELVFTQIMKVIRQSRIQLRRIVQEQIARDVFATVMDVILVIYAIGFLVLSMYQASIIG